MVDPPPIQRVSLEGRTEPPRGQHPVPDGAGTGAVRRDAAGSGKAGTRHKDNTLSGSHQRCQLSDGLLSR
eukprot:CAMPEP_0182942490 /NCGR_PEP_ID=MMETSP0105_2-20130417/50758_1 /TAXON_ID=81532 ORGANISM="Acanthoeca-like sp., Strain 10tr" /NCGR_SAMPLE_ID=MMETSP0105_2 /ASSEMBLY_ACC=CAM_ASM_000205 /LENGTH=69 /DNA_ID=CAMNT_0025082229 /DNA_START=3 /DNA_END=209 /DNA_ORIENTATION=-